MEKIRSWLYKSNSNDLQRKETKQEGATENRTKDQPIPDSDSHAVALRMEGDMDPKVAEYFKYFPEPYKTKAISRFSSREGLYRFDFYRDIAMKKEYQSAMKGVFLEEKREMLANRQEEVDRQTEKIMEEARQARANREIPEWEKAIRSRVHVHPSETLGQKLFQIANLMALGGVVLYTGLTLKKRRPTVTNGKYYMALVGSTYVCGYCQVAAAYRLMDWGPFDRSLDDRDALTKQWDEIKEFFSSLADKVLEEKKKS